MADPIIRPKNVLVMLKLEATEGTDATPSALLDAIPVEADSVEYNAPFAIEQSNEATGSLVAGAPLVIGQAATISFRSKLKGAGNNVAYTASVKPPLHQALQACGRRGQFTAAILNETVSAGTSVTATLSSAFLAAQAAYLGMPLRVVSGAGAGTTTIILDYNAARRAEINDIFAPPIDTTSVVTLPANWTYAGTSPRDVASRLTDHPSGTIYINEDGVLRKFVACRGVVNLTGQSARPGFAEFSFTGIYVGKADIAIPSTIVIASHSGPTLVQGTSGSFAVSLGRKPLPISQWTLSNGGDAIESPDDPNTPQGYGPGVIGGRVPTLALDPLATTVAARNLDTDIGAGNRLPAVLRAGTIPGNSWSLTLPKGQPVSADPTKRGNLRAEQVGIQAIGAGFDAYTRDTESVLCFY
ncbi:hypothetical protein [Sphingomonas solaris]|uniref:Uncharacterized protein n=1 Tax=Alterirhizorhabdus solaris TaxID=2529389 RepID=A0A558R896_9SPHN|nr:hypothetical protein [Sphingomonas solaris]TVV75548.1 hypothetical protein FOY91_06720 [Sphingomonas solaris]